MHKVAIYRRYAYQSPNHRPSVVFCTDHFKTIQYVNKHEIVFHNLYNAPHFLPPGVACTTGLSHNRFTWRPLYDGKKRLRQKVVLCNHM